MNLIGENLSKDSQSYFLYEWLGLLFKKKEKENGYKRIRKFKPVYPAGTIITIEKSQFILGYMGNMIWWSVKHFRITSSKFRSFATWISAILPVVVGYNVFILRKRESRKKLALRRNFYLADVQFLSPSLSLAVCRLGTAEFPVFIEHNNADAQRYEVSSGCSVCV